MEKNKLLDLELSPVSKDKAIPHMVLLATIFISHCVYVVA